jgi:hypothetical protein
MHGDTIEKERAEAREETLRECAEIARSVANKLFDDAIARPFNEKLGYLGEGARAVEKALSKLSPTPTTEKE